MTRLAEGRADALDLLVGRHYAPLLGYLTRLLADRAQAEDLTQETFLKVLRRAATYKADRPFKPWLYAIATNLARDGFRLAENRYLTDRELDESVPDGDAETATLRLDTTEPVAHALKQLSLGYRAVVVLRFYNELSLSDIATALDLPLGTVKSRLHTATRQLAALLKPVVEDPSS